MKIGVVHVNTESASGPYTELVTANLERAKDDRTEIVHRYVRHLRRATDTAIAYPTLLNKVDVVAEMVRLEEDGVDAVMVACSGDPGVTEARTLLHIPVIGPMESAMLLACSYGRKFGIVTVADRTWSGFMEEMVQTYGLTSRYAGQRQLKTPTAVIFTEGFEDPESVGKDIRARCGEMVDAGAEVILMGSAGLSTFASYCGIKQIDDPEVPIFDVISIGFKCAEMRAQIGHNMGIPPVSRAGWASEFSIKDRDRVNRLFGWAPVSTPDMPFSSSYFPADPSGTVVETTVGGLLLDAARRFPDRSGLVAADDPDTGSARREWTYAELARDASQVARALLAQFEPGDHIAVWSPNRYEWTLLEFGIALAGMVLVTVNPALRDREVSYVLAQSRAKCVLAADSFRDNDMLATLDRIRGGLDDLREVVRLDDWSAFVDRAGSVPLPDVDPNSPAQVQYTSGTTGFPKGALLRHISIVNNARFQGERMGITSSDVVLNYMPLFHTGGCVNGTLIPAAFGATQVLMTGFTPHGAIRVAAQEHCSVIGGVTTMYIMMLEQPDFAAHDLSHLRVGWTGGSTVPASLVRQIEHGFGIQLSIVFGQTETSPTITQTRLDDADDDKAGTVGQPLPCTEVKIVDPQTGETLPVGEAGELCTRGYLTMRGYYEMPDATAATIDRDGWLHTGDLCAMDDRGYFSVQGRIRDMIKRGGENIYPREIEAVLVEHPAVADAAVVGVPDPKWSEQPAAFIRVADGATVTEAELVAHLRAHLAPHKTPRIWRFVEAFPLTPSGKVQKFVLRDQLNSEVTRT